MPSRFIRAPHPKTEIAPTAESVAKVLAKGWTGQTKIHGHRVQLHIPADADEAILAYNRQGQLHQKILPPAMEAEARRLLSPTVGWNVVEGEWIKPKDRIYLFDFLKKDDRSLERLNFLDRYKNLPRAYLSPHFQTLPLIGTAEKCLEVLADPSDEVEGLVFKSPSPGFSDTTIVRCRKSSVQS
ncbi:MAG: hypothetical protein JNL01_12585 [Bdellovibrionales bacterium]|nr:hypothetical protein [Bdellovibrionales bacterium]